MLLLTLNFILTEHISYFISFHFSLLDVMVIDFQIAIMFWIWFWHLCKLQFLLWTRNKLTSRTYEGDHCLKVLSHDWIKHSAQIWDRTFIFCLLLVNKKCTEINSGYLQLCLLLLEKKHTQINSGFTHNEAITYSVVQLLMKICRLV